MKKFEVNQVLNLDASIEYNGYKIQGIRQIALDNKPANVRVFISQNSMRQNARELRNRDDGYADLPHLVNELYLFTEGTGEGFVTINYTGNAGNYYKYGNDTISRVEELVNVNKVEGATPVHSILEFLENKNLNEVNLKFRVETENASDNLIWVYPSDIEATLTNTTQVNSLLKEFNLEGIELLNQFVVQGHELALEITACDNFKLINKPQYQNIKEAFIDHNILEEIRGGIIADLINETSDYLFFKVRNPDVFYSAHIPKFKVEYVYDTAVEGLDKDKLFNAFKIVSDLKISIDRRKHYLRHIKEFLIKKYLKIFEVIKGVNTLTNFNINNIPIDSYDLSFDCFVKAKAI